MTVTAKQDATSSLNSEGERSGTGGEAGSTDAGGTSTAPSASLGQPLPATAGRSTAEGTPRDVFMQAEKGVNGSASPQDNMQGAKTGQPQGDTDGAYLVYSTSNEGSYHVVWKKENVPDAIAFAKPKAGIRVPPFKYRGRSEVVRHLNRSKKVQLEGVLQYLRSMQPFQCYAKLLPVVDKSTIRVGDIVLFAHLNTNKVVLVEPAGDPVHLPDADMIAACYAGTIGDTDLRSMIEGDVDVTLNAFQLRCKRNSDSVEVVSLLGPEI